MDRVTYLECEPGTTGVAGVMHRTGRRDAVRARAGGHKGFL